jgi:hypothetical protein
MLGPAFNVSDDNCKYSVTGCIYNESEGYFEEIDNLSTCVPDIETAVDKVLEYLENDAVESVFVNGKIEFDSSDYWSRLEIMSKILDEE